jgi:O-antigen ligase
MLRDVKRRILYIGMVAAAGAIAVPLLPDSFTGRMATIQGYEADSSATTRLAVWGWTWNYAQDNPLGGGFDAYRLNRIQVTAITTEGGEGNRSVDARVHADEGRAWHSAYFEMLGEQGFPGLFLFLVIHLGGLVRMEVIRRRYRKAVDGGEWIAPLATALQHFQVIYLVGASFIAIAFQPFALMIVGVQIGFDLLLSRRESAERKKAPASSFAPRPLQPGAASA